MHVPHSFSPPSSLAAFAHRLAAERRRRTFEVWGDWPTRLDPLTGAEPRSWQPLEVGDFLSYLTDGAR
jgi:hypothetical protein